MDDTIYGPPCNFKIVFLRFDLLTLTVDRSTFNSTLLLREVTITINVEEDPIKYRTDIRTAVDLARDVSVESVEMLKHLNRPYSHRTLTRCLR